MKTLESVPVPIGDNPPPHATCVTPKVTEIRFLQLFGMGALNRILK